MNKCLRNSLKPLFKALSTQGLPNPHEDYEVELLRAGAKPTAMIGKDELDALDTEISNGQIVLIGETKYKPEVFDFFHTEQMSSDIEKIMEIARRRIERIIDKKYELDPSDLKFMKNLFKEPPNLSFRGRAAEFAWHSERQRVLSYLFPYTSSFPPKAYLSAQDVNMLDKNKILQLKMEMVSSGELPCSISINGSIEFFESFAAPFNLNRNRFIFDRSGGTNRNNTYFVAQGQCTEQGQELYRFYGLKEHPKSVAELIQNGATNGEINDEFNRVIGNLLGYTQSDIEYHSGSGHHKSNIVNWILNQTEDIRRWARKSSMILETEEQPKGMDCCN